MLFSLIVGIAVCLLIILSVLFLPEIRLGKFTFGTYWPIALFGALLLIVTGNIQPKPLLAGLLSNTAVNPIKILVLFLSMTGLSVFLDETGFFRYAAQTVLKRAGKSQKRIFVYLYFTVAILTVFTSNDIIVLTFTPFICYFAKSAKIDPVPYLVAEFASANTWSMALIIGNPTNIYIASSFGVDFIEYIGKMLLPTILAGGVSFAVLFLLFNKKLKKPISADAECVHIEHKSQLLIGFIHLALCTVMLALSSYVGFEMWSVSLGFFISLIICITICEFCQKKRTGNMLRTIKRLPWQLVPFVLSMFVIVLSLSEHGITSKICAIFGNSHIALKYGIGSFLSANLINNIPMSVFFVKVLEGLPKSLTASGVYASVIGSNIGAFLTPIGALAGIMWTSILKSLDVKFKFKDFVKYGAVISIPTVLAAISGLAILGL